jgi:hypothetical protein
MMTEPDETEWPAAGDQVNAALVPVVELILALTSDNSPERKAGAERGACVCGAHSGGARTEASVALREK